MRIQISQEDIDGGKQGTPTGCAIALAIRRQYEFSNVAVTSTAVTLDAKKYELTYDMKEFVRTFDSDKSLSRPSEFVLDLFTQEVTYV